MTTPTPPHDLSTQDTAGISGTIHPVDPAAVARLKALMAQQQRTAETGKRQHNGSRIVANLQRAAIAHADKVRFVLSDEQLADVEQRRAAGESWESIAAHYERSHTTLWAAYMRQRAAAKKAAKKENQQ
jgi:hypothetical protein